MALMIPMFVLSVLDALGCICSLYLFFQWLMHIKHKQPHAAWSNWWGTGCILLVIGLVIVWGVNSLPYTERDFNFTSAALIYGAPLLWIRAFVLFRRVKPQDAIVPCYDEPQEAIWPPPPTNTSRP